MNTIDFDSEDLKIDYLSFNLQFNNYRHTQQIADYLAGTFRCKNTFSNQSTKKQHALTGNN